MSGTVSKRPSPCSGSTDYTHPGGDNNLRVSVSKLNHRLGSDNVRCFGNTAGPGIIECCNGLADRLDTSASYKTFGLRDLPHDYLTPYTLTAGKKIHTKSNFS